MGCGEGDDVKSNLTLLEWNGYQHPQFHQEYLDKYGKAPNFTFFAQADDALKRMRAGYKADLVHLCVRQLNEARDSGLIEPIDTSRIARWKDVEPALLDIRDVRVNGEYWILPWEWGYSSIAFNPATVPSVNPGYEMLVDPQFKGRTALTADIGVNIVTAGVIAGWKDPLSPTESEIASAPTVFAKMFENARFVWTDSTQLEQAWAADDVAISYVFGSASRRMPKEGMPVQMVEPLQTWMCGLSIGSTGTSSREAIYDYLNAMLAPASGAAMFDEYGYGHANRKTLDLIPPELITGTGIDDPVGTLERGIFYYAIPPEKKGKLYQLWFEAQANLD